MTNESLALAYATARILAEADRSLARSRKSPRIQKRSRAEHMTIEALRRHPNGVSTAELERLIAAFYRR